MSEVDLTGTTEAKADQLNAVDIVGGDLVITLTHGKNVSGDQPIALHYEGDNGKPFKPCKQMRRLIKHAWGNRFDPKGRQISLYCDPEVTWGGDKVGGIRINAMSHIDKPFTHVDRASRHKVVKYKVEKLEVEAPLVAPPELIKAGDDAASQGSDAYKKWLDGLGDNKPLVKPHHSNWSKIAKEADNAVDDTPIL